MKTSERITKLAKSMEPPTEGGGLWANKTAPCKEARRVWAAYCYHHGRAFSPKHFKDSAGKSLNDPEAKLTGVERGSLLKSAGFNIDKGGASVQGDITSKVSLSTHGRTVR
eukprot:GSA25T00009415001.1